LSRTFQSSTSASWRDLAVSRESRAVDATPASRRRAAAVFEDQLAGERHDPASASRGRSAVPFDPGDPTISPARTSKDTSRSALAAERAESPRISSSGAAVVAARAASAGTSPPTISRAIASALVSPVR